MIVDWGGLSNTDVQFIAFVVHAFEIDGSNGGMLADVPSCMISCEMGGQVFFESAVDVQGSGFFWGFAFKDDQGDWWFIEMDAMVSGYQ